MNTLPGLFAATRLLASLLFLSCLLAPTLVSARTISLVYDDSGSMQSENGLRWQNANYATQVLAALLKQDDVLFCVRMNRAPGGESFRLDGRQRHQSLSEIKRWPSPRNGDGTPYEAVMAAANVFEKPRNQDVRPLGERGTDWLIVATDGGFSVGGSDDVVRKHAEAFFASAEGGRTKVAFLLISDQADRRYAEIWRDAAPVSGQVTIIEAKASDLTNAMEHIVRLTSGRDKTSIKPVIQGKNLTFSSVFPVGRITVLEQRDSTDLAKVSLATTPDGKSPKTDDYTVVTPVRGRPAGQISHIEMDQVMPAGSYTLNFDRDLAGRQLQLLVEPSVDFTVQVLNGHDGSPVARNSAGEFEVCVGDPVFYQVEFSSASKTQAAPLVIDDVIADRLEVKGSVEGKTVALNRQQAGTHYRSVPKTVRQGPSVLTVETKYPGYFHIKSNAITVLGKDCSLNAGMAVSDGNIPVQYTSSTAFQPAGQFVLVRQGDRYQGKHSLSIPDLPKGVQVEVQGQMIARPNDTISIDLELGKPLTGTIHTNKEFFPAKAVPMTLQVKTDNPRVQGEQAPQLTLVPQPRTVALVPAAGQWQARMNELGQVEDPRIDLLVDGRKVPPGEYDSYRVEAATAKRLRVELVPDPGGQGYRLRVRPHRLSFLTSTGKIPVRLSAEGQLPGERTEQQLILMVEDISWWQRYGTWLIGLFVFCAVSAWAVACKRKSRFAKEAAILYQRVNRNLNIRQRQDKHYLSSWLTDKGGRLSNLIKAYLWPFGPEKRTVEGVTFHAGSGTGSTIVLPSSQQSKAMKLNLLPLENPGERDIPLRASSLLEVVGSQYTDEFRYQKQ